MSYNDYLNTDYWKAVAGAVKARANWKCQVCNSPLDLNAHHRTYDHRGDELNHLSDLICLCRRCHAVFHGKDAAPAPVAPTPAPYVNKQRERLARKKEQKAARHVYDHEADMPGQWWDGVLTRELIFRMATKCGAFTNATLRAVGVDFPLKSGWRTRLEGKKVSRDQYKAALLGRNIYA